ncbi:MAG: 3-ketoacyl-ACP reductase [Verrucomicrobiota bacterium]|jgi:NAD(P)-dependent dehydrogenase (short-subunit alcohol dehydrogenase family)
MTADRANDPKKRVALVTGGARGIGFGIARALAREGFDLTVCGVREGAAAEPALAVLRQLGAAVLYVQADISDSAARQRLVEAARERFGRLHLLVNNAGVAPKVRADILEATEESFEWVLRVNLQGPYFLTQRCAQWMIAQKKADPAWQGCIVNVSSISATVASTNRGDYCVSKAGVAMATQLWAARLGEFGLPVYEIRPGLIQTDMTAATQAKYDKLIAEGLLVEPRWGAAEDIGKAVAMLARGDLPYATGQVLNLDGGLTLRRL